MAKRKIIDEKMTRNVARLSRIALSDREVTKYKKQLESILEYIRKIDLVDSKDIPPTNHPLENLKNVFRKDVARKSLTPEEALKNAPDRKGDFFRVPRIIG
ncbi:MAG: Asp-tRNA(Asn)/Glu-tRNA(Gln) amidotransferase subunit GatC [Omnitrophica bacterium]|nr:Asp-tRNA(Asn)/Glu-tRNA(Gln) amidotransferase subunit GatC [Candidatus Omnitrophota bacterium]